MTRLFNRTQFVAVSAVLVGLLFMTQPAQAWWPFGHNLNIEKVYYDQQWLVEAELEDLLPETPGKRDLYVVGVAGHGTQDLFLREILEISALVGKNYDTSERTVKLINNKKTLDTYPLANYYNLRSVVFGLSEVMNPEEDVLLLVMTSHGSPGRFSTWFPPLYPRSLRPWQIRSILDGSGIKNRVIIIQACYSGSFIKRLEDENTLIITAARADRASFGCSDNRDWTYFNQAYFDKSFRASPRFIGAYFKARNFIDKWEKGFEDAPFIKPSLPQISIGDNIVETLKQLEIDHGIIRMDQASVNQ